MNAQPDLFGPKWRWCAFCGGQATTSDHVPAKVFLDPPYPINLLTVPSCEPCNNAKSLDEQYLSCVIDTVQRGSADPADLTRESSRKALSRSPRLRGRIERSMQITGDMVVTQVDPTRVERVLKHIGAGHLWKAHGQALPVARLSCGFKPFILMDHEERLAFEYGEPERLTWPTPGSRRLLIAAREYMFEGDYVRQFDWHELQPQRYRFAVLKRPWLEVRFVFAGYLGCRVWLPKPFKGATAGRFLH